MQRLGQEEEEEEQRVVFPEEVVSQEESRGLHVKMMRPRVKANDPPLALMHAVQVACVDTLTWIEWYSASSIHQGAEGKT